MKTEEMLRMAGVSRCYRGFDYFVEAVDLVMAHNHSLQDMRREIYEPLAEKHDVESKNIERNIRTIRDVIMRNPNKTFLRKITEGTNADLTKMYPRELIEAFVDFKRRHP